MKVDVIKSSSGGSAGASIWATKVFGLEPRARHPASGGSLAAQQARRPVPTKVQDPLGDELFHQEKKIIARKGNRWRTPR